MGFFELLSPFVWKMIATGAILVTAYAYIYNQGAQSARMKNERANANAVSIAEDAATRSRDPAVKGVRDPFVRQP